ncbi:MAG TPA: outer membrane protein assembly factor BamA [Vicinamibacteria bacterium]|nr:outer membrane protein assembly factor BamA [Vicinamibacteria bacterium]
MGHLNQIVETVKKRLLPISVSLCLCGVVAVPAAAQQPDVAPADAPIVEKVQITRNQFLSPETFLFYISTKAGDRYDEKRLKDDFRRVWETGFVDDLLLDVRDGQKGKVVTFVVVERPRVQIVDYRGSKALTTTTIEDELKKREAAIRLDSFYDINKAKRVEAVIRDMLAEKGRPFGTVKHETRSLGGASTQLSFVIEDGPKAKIREIDFVGNEVFSDGQLRGRMKKLKQAGFWNLSWLTGKTTYTEEKWSDPAEGDRRKLEDFYLDHGYVTAQIGEPRLVYTDEKTGKKPTKRVKVEIPVSEGAQYRVGDVKIEGMTVFKADAVLPMFKIRKGDVYKESRIKKAYDKLRDWYGAQGYFQWSARTDRKPNPETKTVDVALVMEEDKRYYVGKISFTGNSTTRDKVIRREVYLNEGDVFNTEALKLSIRRINQLGYFKPMEGAPELKQSELGADKLDVVFKVEEQNRNQFTFGGGVSGLEGTFINASFQTSNFLGQGETFQVSAQSGRRTKNYQIAITEPYLFDRPITAGIDLFSRRLTYEDYFNVVGYTQESTGAATVVGLPLGRFTRLYTNYSYEIINIEGLTDLFLEKDQDGDPLTPNPPRTDTPTTPIFDPFLFGEEGKRHESKFTPSFVHNTVDNPWTPRSGVKFTMTPQIAGGILGGTVNFFKPNIEFIGYLPHTRRTALGVRAEAAYVRPFGDTQDLPYYQRFFLGGETQIRGVNIRTVGPIDENQRALGGNKFVLFNAEYYFDIGGPLRAVLFFDAGQAFKEGQRIDLKQLRTSTGAEMRFIMPVLNVPFRLIYAINPNRDAFQPRSTFKFAVGTTF